MKTQAIALRKKGSSIGYVEKNLKIPRSTLSGWFKGIELSKFQKQKLFYNWKQALIIARQKAVIWHNTQKAARILQAELEAQSVLSRIKTDNNVLDLALAMLYLGEGFKAAPNTAMGNSNPLLLKFFVSVLRKNYHLEISKIKCELHLRADQNPLVIKRYWARELKLPLKNFITVSIDQRTKGSATYTDYKGVCVVRCGQVAIQRKLLFLGKLFCEGIINQHMGG